MPLNDLKAYLKEAVLKSEFPMRMQPGYLGII
jgi:hypothetical protein